MSQVTYEIIRKLFEIYPIILQIVLFLVLWNVFFRWEKGIWIVAGILAVMNICMGLWLEKPGVIRYIMSAVIVMGYCFCKYQKHLEKAVFILLLFYNFHALSYLIADSIYQCTVESIFRGLDVLSEEYIFRVYLGMAIGMGILLLSYTLVLLIMTGVVIKIVKKPFMLRWQETIFLSVLNIVGSMIVGISVDLSVVQIEGGVFLLYDDKQEMLWKLPIIAVLIYVGEISAIYIYQNYRKLQKERQKHFVEEQQVKAMKQRLEEAENFYGSIRRVRHEMKNHMTNIKGLVASEKYDEVENYIEKLDETIQTMDYKFNTGNAVTDVIINDKYQKAENAGISFQVKFNLGETDTISAFDIGIILNNLLDNAIEACEKLEQEQRYINLTLKKKNHFLLIEVENSFDGKVIWKDGGIVPMTTKQSDLPDILMEHGIGLKNVKDVADHYLGDMDIKIKNDVFKVTVMLQQNVKNKADVPNKPDNILVYKTKCACCGGSVLIGRHHTYSEKFYYKCKNRRKLARLCENKYSYDYSEVMDSVFSVIRQHMSLCVEKTKFVQKMNSRKENVLQYDIYTKQIAKLQNDVRRITANKSGLYEDYREQLITAEELCQYQREYESRVNEIEAQITELLHRRSLYEKEFHIDEGWEETVNKYMAKRKLTKELVDAFVSEIVFYDGNIEVKLLYDDFLKELLKVAEEREVSSNG